MNRTILYLFLSVSLYGCAGQYIYPSKSLNEQHVENSIVLNDIVLGLVNTKNMDYGYGRSPSPPSDLESLMYELKARKIFKEVDFVENLTYKPNVLLSNYRDTNPDFRGMHGEAGGPLCNIFASILTLFIIPMYCDVEEEVEFILTNSDKKSCRTKAGFKRNKTSIGGWVAPLFYVSDNWYSKNSKNLKADYSKRYNEYAVSKVIENRDLFIDIAKCN